jgi:SOS-response transcriptional repressor LexA
VQRPDPDEPADKRLTPRRRKIVQVIDDSVRRNGYSPTYREIGHAVGLASTSSVSHQVSVLQALGLVSREPGRPRTTQVRPRNEPAIRDQAGQGAGRCRGQRADRGAARGQDRRRLPDPGGRVSR